MECPKCRGVDMKESRVKSTGTRIDLCPNCNGIWFDGKELEAVLGVASKDLEVPPDAKESRVLSCPRCDRSLFRFQYPQTYVKIEMCKKCRGLWLDAGEFKEIKAVRQTLAQNGKLEERAIPAGVKGGIIRFINAAISDLSTSDF